MTRPTLFSLALFLSMSVAAHAQVMVIAHPSVNVPGMTKSTVVEIFTLATTKWSNGVPVIVMDLRRDVPAKRQFYEAIGKDPAELRKGWMRSVLTGGAKAPQGVDTEEEMLKLVASTPGAIGYVSSANETSEVNVLLRLDASDR